jgi:uncharacterized protein YjbI with pentapeptide repeats
LAELHAERIEGTGGSMPEEFEGDLAGAVFWGVDLSGARFRDVNLTDVKISHAWLVNVDVDARSMRLSSTASTSPHT